MQWFQTVFLRRPLGAAAGCKGKGEQSDSHLPPPPSPALQLFVLCCRFTGVHLWKRVPHYKQQTETKTFASPSTMLRSLSWSFYFLLGLLYSSSHWSLYLVSTLCYPPPTSLPKWSFSNTNPILVFASTGVYWLPITHSIKLNFIGWHWDNTLQLTSIYLSPAPFSGGLHSFQVHQPCIWSALRSRMPSA